MAPSDKNPTGGASDETVSPEFLKKLEAIRQRKGGQPMPEEAGWDAEQQAEQAAPSAAEPESGGGGDVSPEFLKKLEAMRKAKSSKQRDDAEAAESVEAPPEPRKPRTKGTEGAFPGSTAFNQKDHDDYGIDKAVELMRQLPIDDRNADVMIQVVRSTLESFNIKIDKILTDAEDKMDRLQLRAHTLQEEATHLEEEARKRRGEIRDLEKRVEEIAFVKARLGRSRTNEAAGAAGASAPSAGAKPPGHR
jgi:hypothetical protein